MSNTNETDTGNKIDRATASGSSLADIMRAVADAMRSAGVPDDGRPVCFVPREIKTESK